MPLAPGKPPNVWAFWSNLPEFEALGFATTQSVLDQAIAKLTAKSWSPADYPYAVMYLAAHNLAIRWPTISSTSGALSSLLGTTDTFVRSVGFGERRVMFGERTLSRNAGYKYGPGEALYEQTIYGQMFLELRTRNIPAVLLI